MACLVRVSFVQEVTNSAGGSVVLNSSEIMSLSEYKIHRTEYPSAFGMSVEIGNDVHEYMHKDKTFNEDFLREIASQSPSKIMEKIKELGDPRDRDDQPLSHAISFYRKDKNFRMNEILKLGDPLDRKTGRRLSMSVALNGGIFSAGEIVRLGNPRNRTPLGTIGHIMAVLKHKFPVNDIMKLGNPVNEGGQTIGHIMAMVGHEFSQEEVEALGNPKDKRGMTIFDSMKEYKDSQ